MARSGMLENFGIYFFEVERGGHSSTRTPPQISRSQDQSKKKKRTGGSADREEWTGFHRGFYPARERERGRESGKLWKQPGAYVTVNHRSKKEKERGARETAGWLGFTRASLVYKPWNENRKVVRQGANLLSLRCRRRNRKTPRQPVSSLSSLDRLFLSGPRCAALCSPYVRQCRGTADASARERHENDLRLGRGRFGPPTRRRWVSRCVPSSSSSMCCVVGVVRDPGAHTCGSRSGFVSRVKCHLKMMPSRKDFMIFRRDRHRKISRKGISRYIKK